MKKTFNIKTLAAIVALFLVSLSASAQFSGGNGTENNPYIITTPAQLAQLATLVNEGNTDYNDKHYKLGNELDLSEYGEGFNGGAGWIPIGQVEIEFYDKRDLIFNPFKGVFDGDNHIIYNLHINIINLNPDCYSIISVGLFGSIENGIIKNLGVVDVNISLPVIPIDLQIYTGAIVGLNFNSNISNCFSTGVVYASADFFNSSTTREPIKIGILGGIVGRNSGSISNCYSTCDIYSEYDYLAFAGGIVGENSGDVFKCYSTSDINSKASFGVLGGVVGFNTGTVSSCGALNPRISFLDYEDNSYIPFGRVVGINSGLIANNIAFKNMLNHSDNTTWSNIGSDDIDGEDISSQIIWSDGTLGGRFTTQNGWTTQNGKLPGLFGQTVDMPEHLILTGISNNPFSQNLTAFVQNGDLYISGLILDEKWYIYSISGIMIYEDIAISNTVETRNALSQQLPTGIYIIKSGTKTTTIIIK